MPFSLVPASRWRRLGAATIDAVVVYGPAMVATLVAFVVVARRDGLLIHEGSHLGSNPRFRADFQVAANWINGLAWAANAAYVVPLTAIFGQTLGKRSLGVRVVRQRDGRLPGWRVAMVRYATYSAPAFIGFALTSAGLSDPAQLALLGSTAIIVPILFDRLRRGVHDFAAGTVVVVTASATVEAEATVPLVAAG